MYLLIVILLGKALGDSGTVARLVFMLLLPFLARLIAAMIAMLVKPDFDSLRFVIYTVLLGLLVLIHPAFGIVAGVFLTTTKDLGVLLAFVPFLGPLLNAIGSIVDGVVDWLKPALSWIPFLGEKGTGLDKGSNFFARFARTSKS